MDSAEHTEGQLLKVLVAKFGPGRVVGAVNMSVLQVRVRVCREQLLAMTSDVSHPHRVATAKL